MKRLLFFLLGLASFGPLAVAQQPVFDNLGTYSYYMPPQAPPQIDATVFLNHGQFQITNYFESVDVSANQIIMPNPFETLDTLYYTNFNLMQGDPGFRFDYFDSATSRSSTAIAFDNQGSVSPSNASIYGDDILQITALNIVNRGTLSVGDSGVMTLTGTNIDLARSTLAVLGAEFDTAAYVQDSYWGISTTNLFSNSGFLDLPNMISPLTVTNVVIDPGIDFATYQVFNMNDFTTYYQAYALTATNFQVDVLFLGQTNAAISTAVAFYGGTSGAEKVVQWQSTWTNTLTGAVITNQLYLDDIFPLVPFSQQDHLGVTRTLPNNLYYENWVDVNAPQTFRPADLYQTNLIGEPTFITSRSFPGFVGNISPSAFNFGIFPGTNTAPLVTNAAWGCTLSAGPWVPSPSMAYSGYTNLAGRIEINAGILDLTRVQIDGQSFMSVVATNHFVGSSNAQIFSPVTSFNLRSTNGNMSIANLMTPVVPRITGSLDCWSGHWTNIDASGNGWSFNVTIVNSQLSPTAPSQIQDFTLDATNLVINDILNVSGNLSFPTTQRLTIATNPPGAPTLNGVLNLLTNIQSWAQDFPQLEYVTNYGVISAVGVVDFAGLQSPYQSFVNYGTIQTDGTEIWAKYFQSSGTELSGINGISVQADTAILTNGLFQAINADVTLSGGYLFASNQVLQAGREITLAVTNGLTDGIPSLATLDPTNLVGAALTNFLDVVITNGNIWQAGFGINLLVAPASGDLLGTTVTNTAFENIEVPIFWAAQDRGCSSNGFLNNAALGHLVLDGSTNSLFDFNGIGSSSAIYVDLLEFRDFTATNTDSAGNWTGVQIEPGMMVYYSQALANGVSIAEKLNGRSNGRFSWVSNYNYGYFSSTNLIYPNGSNYLVNAALAQSCDISSSSLLPSVPNCQNRAPVWPPPTQPTNILNDVPLLATILTNPVSQTVAQGGTATFSVVASNLASSIYPFGANVAVTGSLGYQWVFGGTSIPGATSSALVIAQVQPTNAGTYSVIVANAYGAIASADATLTVTPGNDASPLSFPVAAPSSNEAAANGFAAAQGTYNGLIMASGPASAAGAGYVSLAVRPGGLYTGRLTLGGTAYAVSGSFNKGTSWATNYLRRIAGFGAATLAMQVELSPAGPQITGTLAGADGSAQLLALHAGFNAKSNPATAYAGSYTLVVPAGAKGSPVGNGYGTVKVDTGGNVQFVGYLADGTKISQATTLSQEGYWPLYASLNGGAECVISWAQFGPGPQTFPEGEMFWIKPVDLAAPAGFTNQVTVTGSPYLPSLALRGLTSGSVILSGGGLLDPITNVFKFNSSTPVLSGSKFSLSITPATGLFSGSAWSSDLRAYVNFRGVLVEQWTNGYGYFLGPNKGGQVYLSPVP